MIMGGFGLFIRMGPCDGSRKDVGSNQGYSDFLSKKTITARQPTGNLKDPLSVEEKLQNHEIFEFP
jgi:hypothetical protein